MRLLGEAPHMSTTFYDILCIDRYVDMCGYYIISSFKGLRVVRKRKSVSEVYGECSRVCGYCDLTNCGGPAAGEQLCGERTASNTALLWLLQ